MLRKPAQSRVFEGENNGLWRSIEENEAKLKDLDIENQRNIDLLREKQENLEFLIKALMKTRLIKN